MHRPPWLSLALMLALLCACDDSSEGPQDGGAKRGPDGRQGTWYDEADPKVVGTTMLDAGRSIRMTDTVKPNVSDNTGSRRRDGGQGDAATSHGEHGSFATAMRVQADASPTIVDEFDANQVDYFVFRAEAPGFYEIATNNDRFSPDNVLALYDSDQQLLAENDVGSLWPGDLYDTRLVVRVPKAGDYYVRVEDLQTPPEFFNRSFALLYYELRIRPVSAATPGFVIAGSATTPIAFQNDTELDYRYVTVLGDFDQDVENVEFDGLASQALIAQVHPGGIHGDGSTVTDGRVSVSSKDGATLARIDRAKSQNYFRPPIGEGKHRISIERMGERGTNPFYAMDLVMLPDNPTEQHESQNARPEGAETVTLSNGESGRGLLLARVGKGDVDYYRVSGVETQDLVFSCEGESTGSGVRGLTIDIRDEANNVIVSDKEDETGVEVRYRITTRATYYLRMSSAETSGASADPWVRCAVMLN